jgi:hypothetical protein
MQHWNFSRNTAGAGVILPPWHILAITLFFGKAFFTFLRGSDRIIE